jgi:hypothetical protein
MSQCNRERAQSFGGIPFKANSWLRETVPPPTFARLKGLNSISQQSEDDVFDAIV